MITFFTINAHSYSTFNKSRVKAFIETITKQNVMSEDEEVDRILKRKMNELIKKQVRPPQQQKIKEDPMTTVSRVLYDRGDEVLNAAMAQFPNETKLVVSKLAELINSNAINYRISGSELLYIFRTMGLPVTIETQIKIERNGRSLSLSDMLKEKQEE